MAGSTQVKVDKRDDAALIDAIACGRDEAAFNELLRRYERDTFGLALRISSNRERAEEIVQEAMIRVWTSANSFRGEGAVKGWLLSIVAREAIKMIKAMKRKAVNMDLEGENEPQRDDSDAHNTVESSELTSALMREVDLLPQSERQLVALHFAGGCSQLEISQALSIPQQTVSYRIASALKTLKSRLSAAGFSAAIPILSDTGFGDVLTSGIDAPPGLRERVISRAIGRNAAISRRSVRKTAAKSGAGIAVVGTVTVVAAGVAAWFVLLQPAQPPATQTTQVTPAISVPVGERPMTRPTDWHKRWTFENGASEDLFIITGEWTANHETKKMDVPKSIRILPTYTLPAEPMMFTARVTAIDVSHNIEFGVSIWNHEHELPATALWKRRHHLSNVEVVEKFYIYKHRIVLSMNDAPGFVEEHAEGAENGSVIILMQNLSLLELSATPLKEDEVPDFVKDPSELIKTLTKER